ncbi:MAG: rod shape-determining protein RodA [Candidatus Omnitrophota bacterium]|nr:MAG: rod shape-determining protein RodA [Candidatus Omnitrophota bacterium]
MKIKVDWSTFILVGVIFLIGLLNLYSASYNLAKYLVWKQLLWFVFGIIIGLGVYVVGTNRILHLAPVIYIFSLFLLLIVLVLPYPGAHRWLRFGFFNFQPSQLMKIALPLFLISVFSHRGFTTVFSFVPPILSALIPAILIAQEPDLGGALLLFIPLFAFFLLRRVSFKKLFVWIFVGLVFIPVIYAHLQPYQKKRLTTFLNPHSDPLGSGYTIMQSKIAIGSGGITGKGWLRGVQGQLRFLPESHTDFVFPVFAEEWGFTGAVFVLVLYILLLWRLFIIANRIKLQPVREFLLLLLVIFTAQIVINLGMTMGLLPVVGLPLPFFSYGGSDLVTNVVLIALFQGAWREK